LKSICFVYIRLREETSYMGKQGKSILENLTADKQLNFLYKFVYVVCSKSLGTFEIARQLHILAMSGKLHCLIACFLIIILFAVSTCYDYSSP
jgi:hypothetical protein